MKKYYSQALIFGSIIALGACSSGGSSNSNATQAVSWTWQSGSNESNAFGVYGTLGVSATSNIPGARWGAISWVDESGNFWIFGGDGNASSESGNLNDLWKYNPNTNLWTWISGSNTSSAYGVYGTQGVAATTNIPGSRSGGTSWRDASGNLWMFGGLGHNESNLGYLNDMWEYNPNTNQWVWQNGSKLVDIPGVYGIRGIAGHLNNPGSRIGATSWTDSSGNLWMFGGVNLTAHRFNDLWKYNPNSNQWAWISGESTTDAIGIYGTQGVASATNQPGARYDAVSWVDNNGNFWLFGGFGNDASGTAGWLNDLWRYDPTNNQWTWMKGSESRDQDGVYGTQGIAASNNTPGARNHRIPFVWSDKNGNFWLFGGFGFTNGTSGLLNDLWMYNPDSNQWTWESGSFMPNAMGNYGSKGVAASSNMPGARRDGIGWIDANGNLWVFGGAGNGATTNGNLNDLWKYNGILAESLFPVVEYTSFQGYLSTATFVTGIRKINGSSDVYISAIAPSTTASLGLVYAGPLNGIGGQWYQLNYPAPAGVTVQSTNLYGPNNGDTSGTINVVGSYNSVESGATSFGLLYQGALTDGNNPNNWTVLMPPSAISTIAHSNMGELVAGNYNISNDPAGKAFVYNIKTHEYHQISKPGGALSVTIYGIWHNGGTSYTIAGGYSNLNAQGLDIGYVADYDLATDTVSHWTDYSYNNLPIDSVVSHFEGITSDGRGGYNLAADVGAIGSLNYGYQPTFVHITRDGDGFSPLAVWTDVLYPGALLSSANTVYENNLLGVYSYVANLTQMTSFIANVPITK